MTHAGGILGAAGLPETIVTLASLAAVLTAAAALARWLWPRWNRMRGRAAAAADAILGRDAILDPVTGAVLAPPLQSIGHRIAQVEDAVKLLAETTSRLELFERRLVRLETSDAERAAARAESVQLLQTIEAALSANGKENL